MTSYHRLLRKALIKELGVSHVVFMRGWTIQRRVDWQGKGKKPVALLIHHTAGAATNSTKPLHPGNQKGANNGVINYIQNHFDVPAASFTLDRDGTVYVHSAYPIWHAGLGSFRHVPPYNRLGIPDDKGNDYMLGVEVVSKGKDRDFTALQKHSLGHLAQACQSASGWKGFFMRLPNHRTWAPNRKPDSRYSLNYLKRLAVRE